LLLRQDGQSISVCGIFFDDFNRGFELSANTLKLMAERHLMIGFDLYGISDKPNQEKIEEES
jgi:hypothetical protein